MVNIVALEERIKRFNAIAANSNIQNDYGLLKTIAINSIHFSRIETALAYYLYINLNAWHEDKLFKFSENLIQEYEEEILNLPNVTPNGLVLPKTENCAAYNALHREFAVAFSQIGMGHYVERIQYPINIRLQNGLPNQKADSRPRSSAKPHTDIWAGDPAAAMVVFLSVLGDPTKVGIRFMYPNNFPSSFVRSLEDFDLGKEVVENSTEIPCMLQNASWFIMDPYLIHHTTKKGQGVRISIDLRFIPKKEVASDFNGETEREQYFISFNEWRRIGTDLWVTTPESIKDSLKKSNRDYTIGYPVDIEIVKSHVLFRSS